jgi:N-acyl-D-amino-acid deacylase
MPAPGFPRRRFVRGLSAFGCVIGHSLRAAEAAHAFASFDREVTEFMAARKIPGGALAVVKDRRLVYARGYGWADVVEKVPVAANSLFRIASISKPFTAVAIMQLVERRQLTLDARVTELLPQRAVLAKGASPDPRWAQITVRHCLQHTGGWDRDQSFDPMFRPRVIAAATGTPAPASADAVIRFMLGQPLDFAPGTRYAYSNFGYCVLGRIIEVVAKQPYEKFVQANVLAPCGITAMRLGRTRAAERAEREVRYYAPGDPQGENVFPGPPAQVPWPYGTFHLEAMDAHGGWLASAVDLVRFAAALRDPERCPLLKPESWRQLHAPPPAPVARREDGSLREVFYACGWQVRPQRVGANYWHNGSLPGTATLLVRRSDGLDWAVLFNQRQDGGKLNDGAIDPALHRAAAEVKDWPKEDLFPQFRD